MLVARIEDEEEPEDMNITIPSTIQKGARYHRDGIFTGEGFSEGEKVQVRWISEDIEPKTGYRENKVSLDPTIAEVTKGELSVRIPQSRRLTTVVFEEIKKLP